MPVYEPCRAQQEPASETSPTAADEAKHAAFMRAVLHFSSDRTAERLTTAAVAIGGVEPYVVVTLALMFDDLSAVEAERDALRARAEAAEATAARLNAANVRLMRRLAPALSAWVAAADQLAAMGQRAVAAEAALATARAEGAAAERAAWLAELRSDLLNLKVIKADAEDYVRELMEDIAAGEHVRPVEGA